MKKRLMLAMLLCLATGADLARAQLLPDSDTLQSEVKITPEFHYLLFLPKAYGDNNLHWPLVLFLHGASDVGTNIDRLKGEVQKMLFSLRRANNAALPLDGSKMPAPDFPFILIAPQSSVQNWHINGLNALLDDAIHTYRVDQDRVYLTGVSMGGGATWALAIAHPEKFAAIVPVCGSYDPAEAKKLVGLPVWAFHGAKDKVVPIEFDQKMVGAIKAAGGNVKFTIYPEAGHDVWSQTYSNPEMYRWLFQQKRQH